MEQTFEISGLQLINYVNEGTLGHNCSFEKVPIAAQKYKLYGRLNKVPVCLTLYELHGECPSGWTTATWGEHKLERYPHKGPYTHMPKAPMSVVLQVNESGELEVDIKNEVFTVSNDGGDHWYPCGRVSVDLSLFEKTVRAREHRVVYIFQGPSGIGKSYLAQHLAELDIYETDSNDTLPDTIGADVIVVGHRREFSLSDIKARIFAPAEIVVFTGQSESTYE